MISLIAWRNVWRSKGRSFVVLGSIAVGIWALMFASGFFRSFMDGYVEESIKRDFSNAQIHHPKFKEDYDVNKVIENQEQTLANIDTMRYVQARTTRSVVNGMAASSRKSIGVSILGVEPDSEDEVTQLSTAIIEGEYFEGIKSNPILIGYKLAQELKVKLKSKVVLTFQDADRNITAGRFRVAGILKSTSPKMNETSAFVRQQDLNKLLAIGSNIHEIAILAKPQTPEADFLLSLREIEGNNKVESWREMAPGLEFMEQQMGQTMITLIIIIMMALAFGIVNTMLMAVLERVKELGMLMAVGMNKARVFVMIMLETVYLSLAGGPVGIFLGYLTIEYYGTKGIDFTEYSEGLEKFGYESILYPSIIFDDVIQILIGVVITAFLAALFPAYKAIKLKPVEALHKI